MKRKDLVRLCLRGGAVIALLWVVFLKPDPAEHLANLTTILVQGAAVYLFFFDHELLARIYLRIRRVVRAVFRQDLLRHRTKAKPAEPPKQPVLQKADLGMPPPPAPPASPSVSPPPTTTPQKQPPTAATPPTPAQLRTPPPPRILEPSPPPPQAPDSGESAALKRPKRLLWPVAGLIGLVAVVAFAVVNSKKTESKETPPIGPILPTASVNAEEKSSGSTAVPLIVPPPPTPTGVTYRVTNTTRCYTLAKKCTGDGSRWIELGPLNKIDTSDPNVCRIYADTKILRPSDWKCGE